MTEKKKTISRKSKEWFQAQVKLLGDQIKKLPPQRRQLLLDEILKADKKA